MLGKVTDGTYSGEFVDATITIKDTDSAKNFMTSCQAGNLKSLQGDAAMLINSPWLVVLRLLSQLSYNLAPSERIRAQSF